MKQRRAAPGKRASAILGAGTSPPARRRRQRRHWGAIDNENSARSQLGRFRDSRRAVRCRRRQAVGVHERRSREHVSRRVLAALGRDRTRRSPPPRSRPRPSSRCSKIVRIANRYSIPLYTISTGRNLAYGGSAPVHSGSVVLDLEAHEQDARGRARTQAYALVEPGVSYFDLYRYIRERKLKVWIDCPDPGLGQRDRQRARPRRGRTPLPYRDHFGAHCGMEVVLANGERGAHRHGRAAGRPKTWQHFQYGAGPSADGLFAQSNFGVVTKMGFWLLPEPEASMTGQIRVPKHDDIIPLVRILGEPRVPGRRELRVLAAEPRVRAARSTRRSPRCSTSRAAAPPRSGIATPRRRTGTSGRRELRFYGPAKVIAAQWEHVKEKSAAIAAHSSPTASHALPAHGRAGRQAQRSRLVRRAELERVLDAARHLGPSRRVADAALLRRDAARSAQGVHEAVPRRRHPSSRSASR